MKLEKEITHYYQTGDSRGLKRLINTPMELLEDGLLPRDSHLLIEAETILDSLSAYNNRLDNIEREEILEAIEPDSPLYPWRSTTLAIREFYNENHQGVIEYGNEVERDTPPYKIINELLNRKSSLLYSYNREISDTINSIKEIINNSMVDLYGENIRILINDLRGLKSEDFENSILTLIEESLTTIPVESIEESLKALNRGTMLKLMAQGTLFDYPVYSITYWIRYREFKNFDPDSNKLYPLLSIIRDITSTLIREKYRLSSFEKELLNNYLPDFYSFLDSYYKRDVKISNNPLTTLKRYLNINTKKSKTTVKESVNQGELF